MIKISKKQSNILNNLFIYIPSPINNKQYNLCLNHINRLFKKYGEDGNYTKSKLQSYIYNKRSEIKKKIKKNSKLNINDYHFIFQDNIQELYDDLPTLKKNEQFIIL